jgi:hypothetical protein
MIAQKDAFNYEKEHKIINPHRMEEDTTAKTAYQPFQVKPVKKDHKVAKNNDAPMIAQSSYNAEFPNWQNSRKDVYHEK